MYVERFRLVLPAGLSIERAALAEAMEEHDKIQVYTGDKAVSSYGITVQGPGAWASGHIEGSMTGYDYKAIYEVYTLEDSISAGAWVFKYQIETSHDELKKVFEEVRTVNLDYDLKFQIQGNNYGISSVFVTYEVIRMVYKGETRDFVVTNNESAGAKTPAGDDYPGGFEAV